MYAWPLDEQVALFGNGGSGFRQVVWLLPKQTFVYTGASHIVNTGHWKNWFDGKSCLTTVKRTSPVLLQSRFKMSTVSMSTLVPSPT